MKKIAFVVPWYGDKIPGGAETETRNIVKNLTKKGIEIEILTTCVEKFSSDWNKNHYKEGNYEESGIKIKRFKVRKRDNKKFDNVNALLMQGKRINFEEEQIFFQEMIRSIDLENYIEENLDNYSLFCFIPYMFGTTYWGVKKAKNKSVLIPCLHDEAYAYMESLKEIFKLSLGCIFLAKPEKELAEKLFFGLKETNKKVIGGGLDINISKDFNGFKEKYNLENPYVLYAGRKDKGKNIDLLIEYFKKFKEKNNDNLDLVLIGGGQLEIPKEIKSYVHDLGFIDIEDKYKAYANAVTLIQPSTNESFSIVIMESWLTGRPVIVNNNFAIESNGGLYFNNYFEFEEILKFYINNPDIVNKMGQNGKEYVLKNFDKEIVTKKYIDFFKELVGEKN